MRLFRVGRKRQGPVRAVRAATSSWPRATRDLDAALMLVCYATPRRRTCVGKVSPADILGVGVVWDVGIDEPGKVLDALSQKVAVMLAQLVPGKIHRSPTRVVHRVDVKLAQFSAAS